MTLQVQEITVQLDTQPLFEPLSFNVPDGKVFSMMGASGCGKSTLLNFICGTLGEAFIGRGEILLNNHSISHLPAHKRNVGLQFQDHLLFPHMTVGENLAFGLPHRYRNKDRKLRVQQALADCDLAGLADCNPASLSGGQRARISLMRTLLSEPHLLLLDEPFSKLDQDLRWQFRDFVFQQVEQRNIPALMVTHDPQDIPDQQLLIRL